MKSIKSEGILFFILLVVFSMSGCDIRQPMVEAGYSSVSFKHTGVETTCLTCHASNQPAALNGFKHYNGNDCVYCHYAGLKWSNSSFHARNSAPSSCVSCHEKDRKPPVASVIHGGGGECVGCHTVGTNWAASGGSPHNPTPTTCVTCHAAHRPAPVNGRIHYNGNDCIGCHVAGGVWGNYKLYSHTPTTTNCNSCHENNRPALSNHPSQSNGAVTDKRHYVSKDCSICHKTPGGSRVFSFVHTNSAGAKINFCLPCHYTKGWSEHGGSGRGNFSGDGNCYNCHNRGRSWAE